MFVQDGLQKRLSIWTQYELHGRVMSKIEVLQTVRLLIPPVQIGLGEKESAYGISYEDIQAWLNLKGYQVLASIEDSMDTPINF